MDGFIHDEREALERRIHEMMAEQTLPPDVTGLNVVLGSYADGGEPTVWLQLLVPSDASFDDDKARQYAALLVGLQQNLTDLVPDRLALVEMRLPPDDPALKPALAHA